jgi:hypothetical protein
MTAWTAESLPPELVAILDEQAGRAHSPAGAVRSCLADILNAYDAMRAESADWAADRDRLRAENRLLKALLHIPTGSCHRTAIHPPHRWLSSRTTQHCPGFGPGSTPTEDRPEVAYEFGFENMDRGGEGPMMIGRPEADVRAAMAEKAAMFPECRYALRRRVVGPWGTVEDAIPGGDR